VNPKQGKGAQNHRTKAKAKVGKPKTTVETTRKEKHHEEKEGHGKMV